MVTVKVCTAKTQKCLEEELERLRQATGVGQGLSVVWMPSADRGLSGEVRGSTIYVYEAEVKEAVQTLRHELMDYLVSQAIEPYKEVTNRLIKMINDDAYRKKERVVETLTRLLKEMNKP
jgi:hypothetical protein